MPEWKQEIRQRLANLKLEPAREATIVEELAQDLEDCHADLLAGGATVDEAYRLTLAELSESDLLAQELWRIERQVAPEPIILGTGLDHRFGHFAWERTRLACDAREPRALPGRNDDQGLKDERSGWRT